MNKVNVIKQNLEFIGKTWIKYIGTFASILSLFFLFWTWDDIRITSTQYKCVIIILLCVLALILAILWTCIFKRTKTIWESPSGKIKVCYSDIMKDGFDKRNKLDAIQYYQDHKDLGVRGCAENLGIGYSTLTKWLKDFRESGDIPVRGSGNYASDEQKEIARLRRELRDAQDALDVLKKAINILGK